MIKDFVGNYRRAKQVIAEIKQGLWVPRYNNLMDTHPTAYLNGHALWLSNGPAFCDIEDLNAFGYLFRHWVWFAAAGKLYRDANKANNKRLKQKKQLDKIFGGETETKDEN